jgi:non-heme chloroperoxidase
MEVFNNMRSSLTKDRSQFYKDLATQFYGANRPGAKVSQGILDQFWLWSMQAGLKNAYESIKAFSETDFTEDLRSYFRNSEICQLHRAAQHLIVGDPNSGTY